MDASAGPPELQTVTSSTLLEGLKNATDRTRWQLFVDRYRPLLLAFVGSRGLDPHAAEDCVQTTLLEFANAVRAGRYDPGKGRLRAWLFGIVRRQLLSARRSHGRTAGREEELQAQYGDPRGDELEAQWEAEWRRAVLAQCLAEVRAIVEPTTFAAFREFALEERPAADVARELGISENAVFGAKRRVLQRMRELLPLVEDIW